MKRDIAFLAVTAWLTLAMGACAEAKPRDLKSRDLAPVNWMKTPAHSPVEIVRGGKARAVVYLADPKPSATLKLLVDEMLEVIRLSSGATLKLVAEAPPADNPAIVIGDCAETRKAGIAADKIPIEGFVVKTAANRVYLVGSTRKLPAGSTRWASWSNEGSAWAVADFLERAVGVRWYWPPELGGRSITSVASLVMHPAHYSDQPVFRLREYFPSHGWKLPAKARSSDKEPLAFGKGAIPKGVAKIPMGTYLPLVRSGCSWPYKIKVHQPQSPPRNPPEGWKAEDHKQLLALKKDGTRDSKMFCYRSPKTLEFLLAGCERSWDKGQGCPWVTSTCVTVSPPDRPVDCHCPACRETLAKADDFFDKDSIRWFRGPSLTMALFAKRMCEAVKKRWPGKKVIYLPYWNYQECPTKLDFPDNLVVEVAMTTWPMPLRAQDEIRQGSIGTLRAWRSKACMPVTVWDYCVSWTYGPYQYPHVVRDFYPAVKDIVAGSFLNGMNLGEWTNTAPTLYVWMKALWNPELDVDAVLDEMCRRLFGKAGATAREMVRLERDLWEKGAWRDSRVKVPGGWFVPKRLFVIAWTPDVVQRLKALRSKALAELADDPAAKQRFGYWTWTFDAFCKDAREIELTNQFKRLATGPWQKAFHDSGTGKWQDKWFLDGAKAKVTNSSKGMTLTAGPKAGDDSCHAVLWTKESFKGDLNIQYEYTKTDTTNRQVTILYIQATGSGRERPKDISKWRRNIPSMSSYFNRMNLYHISYAAFGQRNDDPKADYIRARRYMPEAGKGLAGTALKNEYSQTSLFKTGVPYRITVIKKGKELFMHIKGDRREKLCHFTADEFPAVTEGRIGLRHMYTRGARYRDFRVSVPAQAKDRPRD